MKRLFSLPLLGLLLALSALTGCKKDEAALDSTITPVSNVFSPADNQFVKLDPPTNAVVTFQWQPAQVADGTVVLYEVLFDKVGGDFSKPFYSQVSGTNGLDNKLVLSHGELNKIAALAGIAAQDRGKMIWSVNASKGLNVVRSSVTRTLEVQRPAGFAVIPGKVYIYGAGTEYGTALAGAQALQSVAPGVFEIYTQLSAGAVLLTDATTGTPTNFYVDGQNLRAGTTGVSPTSTPKVYRLTLDFNNGAAKLTEIVSVGLWISAQNKVTVALPYLGKGQWQLKRTPIEFFQFSWGRDERYKFQFTEKDAAGNVTNPYYGSTVIDNQRATAASPAAYYYLVPQPDSQWDYTFKFRSEADKAPIDLTVTLQPGAPYTHSVTL